MNFEEPERDEIITWAYSQDNWPNVDWPLFLSWKEDLKTWIKLATDHNCSKKCFFKYLLYYQVGKAYSGSFGKETTFIIQGYLEQSKGIKHGDIKLWQNHVKELLKEPEYIKPFSLRVCIGFSSFK